MNHAYIVHRWGETPESDWYKNLKQGLEKRGYTALLPEMPNTDEPIISEWVSCLSVVVDDANLNNAIFVGHSIGCQTILRYFETLPEDSTVGAAVFVAGWFNLENLEDEESEAIAQPWITTPIDFEKVSRVCDRYIALFSTNDPWVPVSDAELFKERLGAKIIIKENAGHFTAEDGFVTAPNEAMVD